MQVSRDNLNWAGRMMSIIAVLGLADVLLVVFAHRPLPWVGIVSALIPLLAILFVVIPMMRAKKN